MEQQITESNEVLALLDHINGSIAVVGSMNADYTVATQRLPKPGETVNGGQLEILPGGKSANQASAAAKIGAKVSLYGALGQDSNADFLLANLTEAGVDVSGIKQVPTPSGTTVITVDQNGENTIVYSPGSNAEVTAEYVRESSNKLIQAKTLGLCLESPIEAVTQAAQLAHDAGLTVLLNNSPFQPVLAQELIDCSDILLVNEHEMAELLKIDEPADGNWINADWNLFAHEMEAYGFSQAIVTLGSEGSMILNQGNITRIQPVKINAVDTTGCGDAFMGTVLAGLSSGIGLASSAQLASYVSAYAATGRGAQASYGSTEQIRNFFL